MRIIGWTEFDDPKYKERLPIGGDYTIQDVRDTENTIAEELRRKGYRFDGTYHQNGDFGVPIFEDGTICQFTFRSWGHIMALAYPEEIEDKEYGYLRWAWMIPDGQMPVFPKPEDYEREVL